jgi:hypothetical protein
MQPKPALRSTIPIYLLAASAFTGALGSESRPVGQEQATSSQLTDLTVVNLFTEGWGESWIKRPHPGEAPDLTLLRVQSNLLLQSLRTDSYYEHPTASDKSRAVEYVSQTIEYAWNRRIMLAVFGNYQWLDRREGDDIQGGSYGGLVRLQLWDVPHASYALNLRVAAPNDGLGETQTLTSVALAGWHDLTPLGLRRMGVYWHVQGETEWGPGAPGSRRNDLTYDLSVSQTWSKPEAWLGNFSTFIEAYFKTDLDGPHSSLTIFTLTPGFRFNVHHHHVVMFGAELPATTPKPFDQLFRLTYIYSF